MILVDNIIDQLVAGNLSYSEYIAMSEDGFVDTIKSASGTVTRALTNGPSPAPLGTPGPMTSGGGSLPRTPDGSIMSVVGNFAKGALSTVIGGGSGGSGLSSLARQYGSGIGAAGSLIGGLGKAAGLAPVAAAGNAIGGIGSLLNPPRPAVNNQLPPGFEGSRSTGFKATPSGGSSPIPKSGSGLPPNAIGQNSNGDYMYGKTSTSSNSTPPAANKTFSFEPFANPTTKQGSSSSAFKEPNSSFVPKPVNSTFKASGNLVSIGKYQVDSSIKPYVDKLTSGTGLRLSSGYRTPEHNTKVHGVSNSPHLSGMGFDLVGTPDAMRQGAARVKELGGRPLIHNAGSGMHLHSDFRPKGY